MARADGRSEILAAMAIDLERAGKLTDFVVDAGETRALSYKAQQLRERYQEVGIRDADQLKDVIGAPDLAFRNRLGVSIRPTFARAVRPLIPNVVNLSEGFVRPLPARVLDPDVLSNPAVAAEEREEGIELARRATEDFVFSNSAEAANWRPLIDRFLTLRAPKLFIPFFRNIIINDGGTLNVARDTLTVFANRIRLFGSGRINCDGPTTFDCQSLEGKL
jgi:hypothetical protein